MNGYSFPYGQKYFLEAWLAYFSFVFVRSYPGRASKMSNTFVHTHARATLSRAHSRTRNSRTRSRRTCGNQQTTKLIKRTENFISNLLTQIIIQICSELSHVRIKRTSFFIILHCFFRVQISFSTLKALQCNNTYKKLN